MTGMDYHRDVHARVGANLTPTEHQYARDTAPVWVVLTELAIERGDSPDKCAADIVAHVQADCAVMRERAALN